jgi:hypothetical protein
VHGVALMALLYQALAATTSVAYGVFVKPQDARAPRLFWFGAFLMGALILIPNTLGAPSAARDPDEPHNP